MRSIVFGSLLPIRISNVDIAAMLPLFLVAHLCSKTSQSPMQPRTHVCCCGSVLTSICMHWSRA